MSRVAPDATAFAHRQQRVMVNVAAMYVGPTDRVVKESWVRDLATALERGDGAAGGRTHDAQLTGIGGCDAILSANTIAASKLPPGSVTCSTRPQS